MADQNELRARQRKFQEFYEQDHGQGLYGKRIEQMINSNQQRLIITIDDLRRFDPALATAVLYQPVDYIPIAQKALVEVVKSINEQFVKEHMDLFVGFDGNFGMHHVTPRGLTASFLGQIVCLEGIITKCYEARSKVAKSVHYVAKTGKQLEQTYSDAASLSGVRTAAVYPKQDENGNALTTEFGLSVYYDNQRITMQEMPEKAPAGQLPRSVDIVLTNDLVDIVKPGDRVRIIGIYRAFPSKNQNSTSGVFKTALLGTHIERITKIGVELQITREEIQKMKTLAKEQSGAKVFHHLARSIAPSIYGHEWIKKAILCMLLGGVEKNLDNGAHLRGDINVLMVGDPSTAKSQVLRFVINTAPLAVATTGRGSSGVGLTAAVLTDQDTGERRLEAGAMVLADRGVVCIDEFDKMSEADRVAIHEVMEQQTVTINKASIHTTLNARCSVLAAANPIYGQYKENLTTMENVNLPDSLLSRFDLLFIVLDTVEPNHDRMISQHVLRNHTYRAPNEPDGYVNPAFVLGSESMLAGTVDDDDEDDKDDSIYEKAKTSLHNKGKGSQDRVIKLNFLKKYLFYCKRKFKPVLTQEASDYISSQYADLRSSRALKTQPITPRTLETMIRLACAMAKCRLSHEVTMNDAVEALKVLKFALYAEEPEPDVDETELTYDKAETAARRLAEREDASYEPGSKKRFSEHAADAPTKRTRHTETDEPLSAGIPIKERVQTPRKKITQSSQSQSQPTEEESEPMDSETLSTQEDTLQSTHEDNDVDMTIDVADPPHQLGMADFSKFSRNLGTWLRNQPDCRALKRDAIKAMQLEGWSEGQARSGFDRLISMASHLFVDGDMIYMEES